MAKGSSSPAALENNNVASLHSSSVQNIQNEVTVSSQQNQVTVHSGQSGVAVPREQNGVTVPSELIGVTVPSEQNTTNVPNVQNEAPVHSELISVMVPSEQNTTNVPNVQNEDTAHSELISVTVPSEQNTTNVPNVQNENIAHSELIGVTVPSEQNTTNVPNVQNEAPVHSELISVTVPSEQNTTNVPNVQNEATAHSELISKTVPSEQNTTNVPNVQNEATAHSELISVTGSNEQNTTNVPNVQNKETAHSELIGVTVPSEQNTTNVPNVQNEDTAHSELIGVRVPSEQNTTNVPNVQNENIAHSELIGVTVPSEQNTTNVPNVQNEATAHSELIGVTVPSEQNTNNVPNVQNEAAAHSELVCVTVPSEQNTTNVPNVQNEDTAHSELIGVTVPSEQNTTNVPNVQNEDTALCEQTKTNVPSLLQTSLSDSESFRQGVIPDFSRVDTFHLRVPVNPCDEEGATGYSHGSYEGATVHSHHQLEGATGYSKHLHEGPTGYSKELCEGVTSCSKNSSQSSDVLTRYESVPTSYCQDTDGRCRTYNKDSKLLPSTQQMNQHVFPRSRLNGRELSPLRVSYSPGEKHGEKIRLHKERYDTPKEHCSKLHVNHLKAVKPYKTHIEDLRERVKEKYHPSVGKILFCMEFKGTCFVVGRHERRFIVTANHIFEDIGEYFKWQKSELAIKNVIVQFESDDKNSPPIYYRLNSQVRHYSNSLDYLAVEMVPHKEFGFPPPIREFGRISHLINDKRVICIAFQNGELWRDMTGALYLADIRGRLESMKLDSRELLDLKKEVYAHKMHIIATSMIYGSSGGIVVLADSDLKMRVIGMILKGYPKEFYEDPSGYRKRKGCHLVEVMISIEEIANDFNRVKNEMGKKFLKEVFGRF